MKKCFLFITLLTFSCTMPKYSYFDSSSSFDSGSDHNESESFVTSEEDVISESSDSSSIFELKKVDDHHVIYYSNGKEIDYFAEYIIDGEEFIYDENLYINENRNQICFLVINKGRLIFEDTSFLKEGDAYEPRNALQYGKNALVTLIGESTVIFKNCSINIFSKGSSMIHLMKGSSAYVENVDIVITDEYSCAFSYYNNEEYVSQVSNFIFIDNEKSKESVVFYDE